MESFCWPQMNKTDGTFSRWMEHFWDVLNQPDLPATYDFTIEEEHIDLNVNMGDISVKETEMIIKELWNNKAAGLMRSIQSSWKRVVSPWPCSWPTYSTSAGCVLFNDPLSHCPRLRYEEGNSVRQSGHPLHGPGPSDRPGFPLWCGPALRRWNPAPRCNWKIHLFREHHLSRWGHRDQSDVQCQIRKASDMFRCLQHIWTSASISRKLKLWLYASIVVSIYVCKTWKLTVNTVLRINMFHQQCLWQILKEVVLWWGNSSRLHAIITHQWLRLARHILRMHRHRIPLVAMHWCPPEARLSRSQPRTTWRWTFINNLKFVGISWDEAEVLAEDRQWWRDLIARCSQ